LKYCEVRAKANKTGELLLYGDIASASYWGEEVTPKTIDDEIKALGEIDTLNVYVNSGGGSVFAGQAIYNIIKRCKASIKNAYVDGLAASIASVIPMACDKVYMPSNAMMMVHNPWGCIAGNAEEMRKTADTLDKIRESILTIYAEKTGLDEAKLTEMMDAETWMTAKEAIEMGFADELQEETKIAASIDGGFLVYGNVKVDTTAFKNFKPETVETYRVEPEVPEPVAIKAQNKEFLRIKNKILGGQ
jgi:ATP-dependent Clp protease protease subunit